MFQSLIAVSALLWLVATALFLFAIGRTYFLREMLPSLGAVEAPSLPFITLVIPARNEEHNIEICLERIIALDYPVAQLQVVVVNDHSTDRTRELVQGYAQRYRHIELVDAAALPEGWMGKAHGCWMGAGRASGEWVAFIDADTYVQPRLLASAISYAQHKAIDLLSVIPFQLTHSWQERLWLPGLFLGIAASINFHRVNDPDDPYALANGQFLLFRRDAYDRIGGHEAIKGELADDLAFAARAKGHGLNYYCLFGDQLVETRMYRSLAEIWRGFSKNLAEIMGATSWRGVVLQAGRSLVVGSGLLLLPTLLLAGLVEDGCIAWLIAIVSTSLLVTFLASLLTLRVPWRYLPCCAAGLLLHGALTIVAYRKLLNGEREWKGRRYTF